MSLYHASEGGILYQGDAATELAQLPADTVNCVVTSPPYYGLRDYGVEGQLGLEASPAEYVERLRAVFAEVRRVLRPDGTLWLNLGDSYARNPSKGAAGNGNKGNVASELARATRASSRRDGASVLPATRVGDLPEKNLLGMPWRAAFALQDDGWILRNAVIWHKTNAMPESVKDRLAGRYEHVFMFTKTGRYEFDLDAIREPHIGPLKSPGGGNPDVAQGPQSRNGASQWDRTREQREASVRHPLGKNPGDVWSIGTQPFKGAHFATMPPRLVERCLRAGCPPSGIVLDPFAGSGTTLMVARQLGHLGIGIELNPEYLTIAVDRIGLAVEPQEQPA